VCLGVDGEDLACQVYAVRRAVGRLIPRLRHIVRGTT
jgi:hypothetical protein